MLELVFSSVTVFPGYVTITRTITMCMTNVLYVYAGTLPYVPCTGFYNTISGLGTIVAYVGTCWCLWIEKLLRVQHDTCVFYITYIRQPRKRKKKNGRICYVHLHIYVRVCMYVFFFTTSRCIGRWRRKFWSWPWASDAGRVIVASSIRLLVLSYT